jgi:1-acyl-sn-glycerol-3-phosphate acyltransferase
LFRKKAIDDWAFDYWLLQQYAKLCFHIFFRKIEVINKQNIPLNQPVILAPNHQNALIDAMVLVCNTSFQNVFLARADIFRGPRMIRFLTFLNIMPIYRIRDGIENVKRNDEVFEKTLQVLHNGKYPLGLFAEGNHGDRRRLRPLVKGLFRIAFQAQAKYGVKPGVKIVPVGIDYGHYQNFGTTLFVNIGEPIEVSEFYEKYTTNPVMAINDLKDAFAVTISNQMIDIQTEEYYELYMFLRIMYNDKMKNVLGIKGHTLQSKFKADKAMINALNRQLESVPEGISALDKIVSEYRKGLKQEKLGDRVFRKSFGVGEVVLSSIVHIILFPVFLFGLINNILPFWFAGSRVKNIKDTQFHSSVKYVVGMIVFPFWYIVITGILAFLALPVWLIAMYLLLTPVCGILAFDYYIRMKKLIAKFRYFFKRNSPSIRVLRDQRKKITDLMDDIIKQQKHLYENPR